MASNKAESSSLALAYTLLGLALVIQVGANLDQDRAECTDKLMGLATCLPYVGGDAKTPTLDCCSGLKEVVEKSKKCLCVLIKDRDDPNLGLKINSTLALQLPNACHVPTNITKCIGVG
ncbi:hypothetical protein TIFTF001_035784 [Ficus carica]|uniref:Bifunctional inhibitor/plant lipid transfer protein/seed storage helical domain-containing protein n=1 Tax=Ficus carica TaxID=3494 RepID=A0AA88E346_FICCA|nr:hypothetical protein TIFTF001_035784 [Ficus carica]